MYIFLDKVQEHYNIKNISFINRACVYMATVAPTSDRKVVACVRWQRQLILIPSETTKTTPKATRGLTETFLDCDETANITHRQWTHVGCERWPHCVCVGHSTTRAMLLPSFDIKQGRQLQENNIATSVTHDCLPWYRLTRQHPEIPWLFVCLEHRVGGVA